MRLPRHQLPDDPAREADGEQAETGAGKWGYEREEVAVSGRMEVVRNGKGKFIDTIGFRPWTTYNSIILENYFLRKELRASYTTIGLVYYMLL